ncbi:MAG: hypothetical protein JW763_05620 [candidate division Zixibacteria bacterium]|nr:hypothetical protein [candidate division Zixibacteria bacterium]
MSHASYQTSDLGLAAYLAMRGYPILGVDQEHSSKAVFRFKDDAARPDHILKFFNRQTEVEPIGFLDQVKSLKAMLKQ